MLNITLKNIPKDLHARLKESAEQNRRSLNSEILARLESQLEVRRRSRCARPGAESARRQASQSRPRQGGPLQAAGRSVIVVESNVVAYYWVNGPLTDSAERVRQKDREWHAPVLWRSELRSVLTGYLCDGSLNGAQIARVMGAAEEAFAGREHIVPSDKVFQIAGETQLSAYDCEFVALATMLGVPLVTADKAILKAFPQQALSMDAFLIG